MNSTAGRARLKTAARFGLMLAGCGGAMLATGTPARAATTRMVRVGSVPTVPAGSTLLASAASVHSMQVTVTLKPRSEQALSAYVKAVSDTASPFYHTYLTVAQFRSLFAPTTATLRKVEASLRAEGLTALSVTSNGMAIEINTTNAAVERAFRIQLASVRTKSGADVVYNTQAPAFSAAIAKQVNGVVGLNGFDTDTAHPEFFGKTALKSATGKSVQTRVAASVTAHANKHVTPSSSCVNTIDNTVVTGGGQSANIAPYGYTADEIASAYSFDGLYSSGDYGRGQTIALYELEPNLTSDIAAYQQCYGTSTSVTYVKVDGGAGNANHGAGAGEAALDIEQLIGLAPQAHILVYQGRNSGIGPYDTLATIISQNRASVVSTSWGDCEANIGEEGLLSEYYLFQEAAVQGQTMLAAAGDEGSEDCFGDSGASTALAVDDPGSQPLVTSVGGTSLQTSSATSQTAWNDGVGGGAGGGGVSNIWLMPAYQSRASKSLNLITSYSSKGDCDGGSSYCREVPDVSADADENHGYFVYYRGSWQPVGGTSAAAPLWAALVAEANAEPSCQSRRVGMINGELYRLAGNSYGSYFTDVTSGNNDMLGAHNRHYPTGTGYDMATGLGTPVASSLAPALCGSELTFTNPGHRTNTYGSKVRLALHAKMADSSAATVSYSQSGLPRGLKLNTNTGVISGRPTKLGTFTVTVMARTRFEILRTIQFKWTIKHR